MSRIGKQPVAVPAGVEVKVDGAAVSIKGAKGELSQAIPEGITVRHEDGQVMVERAEDTKELRALHGTIRSLMNNMVVGVTDGYQKDLELHGVGFRAQVQGKKLTLNLGYSHPIDFAIPDGLTVAVNNNTEISLTGADKQVVGQSAAQIRSYYKAEPYKGKGVRYKGETIRRKVGKAVA